MQSRVAAWTLAGLVLLALPSSAYRMNQNGSPVACNNPGGFAHWAVRSIPWRHNPAGQGAGKATALSGALSAWTAAGASLTYAGTTTNGFATDNVNTVVWAVGNGCTGSCLALTALVLQPGQVIVEADITFNASLTWTTNGTNYDTRAVATHELGHSFGIHHTEVISPPRPTMYPLYSVDWRTLEADDRAAVQCSLSVYPP